MYGKRIRFGLLIFLLIHPGAFPQPGLIQSELAEELLNRKDGAPLPLAHMQSYQDITLYPIDLNSASLELLSETGLFTPFQARLIIEYRSTYGNLLSVYELASLPGFSNEDIYRIVRYTKAGPVVRGSQPSGPEHRVVFCSGRTFPLQAGYRPDTSNNSPPAYAGSPWKTCLKLQNRIGGRITTGLTLEKDPGEKGFSRCCPELVNGFLQFRGSGSIEQVVVGNFRLHLGHGLARGSGLFHTPGNLASIPLSTIKPYAGTSEWGSHRGVACRLRTGPLKLVTWAGGRGLDLSLSNLQEKGENPDWVSISRTGGLHRTASEINGRALGYLANAGIQIQHNGKGFQIGGVYCFQRSGLTQKGKDSLNLDESSGFYHAGGIHWRRHGKTVSLFGEVVLGDPLSLAFLTGIEYRMNDFLSTGLILHYYSPDHRETFSSAYASGRFTSNEQGMALILRAEPFRNLTTDFSVEIFHYPAPRYLSNVPAAGFRTKFTLKGRIDKRSGWQIRMGTKLKQQKTGDVDTGIPRMEGREQTILDARLLFQASGSLRWQSRIIISLPCWCEPIHGFAAVQQFRVNPWEKLTSNLQFVVFSVKQWENRIYIYEPGMYHQFDFPACYGRGQKTTLVFSLKASGRITIEGKGSVFLYADRETIGTGDQKIGQPRKYYAGIQIRIKI